MNVVCSGGPQAGRPRRSGLALFRYQLIREAADPALTVRQRGLWVREIAARAHQGLSG